jgi:hypothetical protein
MGWIVFTVNVILAGTIFAVALSACVLVLLAIGRRIGVRQLAEEGETASKGLSAIEGAIYGLLGLILAFSFSGALTRFDARRHLVVEEANDIGTAWLRVALLPAGAQPPMRDLFRRYAPRVPARCGGVVHELAHVGEPRRSHDHRLAALCQQISDSSMSSCSR